MAIENLPRPWVLAALTGLNLVELLRQEESGSSERRPERALPRPEPRRRRLGDPACGRKLDRVERLN